MKKTILTHHFSASIISASSLVIEPGKAVWVLYVDATCVNYDGNVFDAALVAMIAALRNSMSTLSLSFPLFMSFLLRSFIICSPLTRVPVI
jgi:hypothetical protein